VPSLNSKTPKASVIIPCYNYGQYLDEAVDSVLHQTEQDFEIIVINDGSTDAATINLLQTYNKPKTKVIHTQNQGVAAARNRGISEAKGRYILPLDADDKIHATYLEKAIDILESSEKIGIVYCNVEFFGEASGIWDLPEYSFPEVLLYSLIVCSGVYRRADWQQVGGYNPNMKEVWEDYDFWLSLIEQGAEVVRIPEALFFYRRHGTSRDSVQSENIGKVVRSYAQLFRNHRDLYTDNIEVIFNQLVHANLTVQQLRSQLQPFQSLSQLDLNCLAAIEAQLKVFRLRDFNLIMFPDWQQSEKKIFAELKEVLRSLSCHPEKFQITLLIAAEGADLETANLMLSGVTIELLLSENLEVENGIEISVVSRLSEVEKYLLLNYCSARVGLQAESRGSLAAFNAEALPIVPVQTLQNLTLDPLT